MQKKRKRIPTQQLLAYILLIAFAAPTLLYVFNWLSNSFKSDNKAEVLQQYKTAPQANFVKEGELTFITKEGKNIKIDIEIAKTDGERSQGLMYRQMMGEMQGMLFLFDKQEPQSFWMKNTFIALDILYVNEQKEIVSITKMAQPKSESPIPSGQPAIYVVEVNGGFCDRQQIKEGDKISWQEIAM
jgi:uncharacterized membrane protein (UPF0127 family)